MNKYTAVYSRVNPQVPGGGYMTAHIFESRTQASACKAAKAYAEGDRNGIIRCNH